MTWSRFPRSDFPDKLFHRQINQSGRGWRTGDSVLNDPSFVVKRGNGVQSETIDCLNGRIFNRLTKPINQSINESIDS